MFGFKKKYIWDFFSISKGVIFQREESKEPLFFISLFFSKQEETVILK